MSDIVKTPAEALNSPIYQEAECHSRRLGQLAIDASCKSWKHDDAMRRLRHAQAEWEIKEASARLAALNASYRDAVPPTLRSRMISGVRSTAAGVAGGALAVLLLAGLSRGAYSTEPPFNAPYALREEFMLPPFDRTKLLQLIGDRPAARCLAPPAIAQPLISFGGEQSAADLTGSPALAGH